MPTWAPTVGVVVALAALVSYSFLERWSALSSSPFPIGVDGYFYPIQLKSLLETGELQYPAAPFAFWLLAPFAAVTDPIVGTKLGASVFCALVAVPAYGVGKRLGGGRGAGLLAASLATTSAGSAYLTNEFVKNGIGITIALSALWATLHALERPVRSRVALALLAIAAALLTHKMAAGLVLVVGGPAWLAASAGRGTLRGRRLLYAIAICGVGGIALLVLGLVFPERFLSAADAALVANVVSTDAHWLAPAIATKGGSMTLGYEALTGALLAIGAIVLGTTRGRATVSRLSELLSRGHVDDLPPAPSPRANARQSPTVAIAERVALIPHARRSSADSAATWAILGLALVIGLPWLAVTDAQALGFRLRIAAFVPMAIAAAVVAGRLLVRVTHRDTLLAALAIVLATRTPGSRADGRVLAHPALVTSIQAMTGLVPEGDLVVVPERHILFMIAWYTGARVSMRPERALPERRWRVMPLAFIGAGSPLDEALFAARDPSANVKPPRGLHPRHPNGLVLVAESTWQWILARLPPNAPPRWREWHTI